MTPLRQQMVAALELNGKSPATVEAYVREVALVAKFYRKRPDRISVKRQFVCKQLTTERGDESSSDTPWFAQRSRDSDKLTSLPL